MNRLSPDERSRVIACLVEGNSQRATVRITGIAKKTVARLAVPHGGAHNDTIVTVEVKS